MPVRKDTRESRREPERPDSFGANRREVPSEGTSGSTDRPRRRRLFLFLRFLIGVSVLIAVLWSIDLDGVASRFLSLRPGMGLLLCFTAVLGRVLMAYKWNLLLSARGISISVWQATRLYLVGHLLGAFTPGAIGADAYRVVALYPFRKTQIVLSTVFLERFIGLAVIALFAVVGLPVSARYLGAESKWFVWVIVGGAVLATLGVVLSLTPAFVRNVVPRIPYLSKSGIFRAVGEFYHTYAESRTYWRTLVAFGVLTAVEVVLTIVVIHLSAVSLGIGVSFGYLLAVMPLQYILLRLPISFQGIGVQEGLFAYFLVSAGFTAADGLAMSLVLRAVELIFIFLPAALLMWAGPLRIQPESVSQ